MKLRLADERDIDAVASVHLAAFPGFFLTSLGRKFLSEMYRGFLKHPSGIFFVAEEGGGGDGVRRWDQRACRIFFRVASA